MHHSATPCRPGSIPSLFSGAGKAIRMQLAAEPMKLLLQRRQVDIQLRLEAEDGKVIAAGRRLNLAAMGAKQVDSLCATEHDQHATGTAESRTLNMAELTCDVTATQRTTNRSRRIAWSSD